MKISSVKNRGALLLELLVVISVLAIILSIGSQSVYVSMQGGKVSNENDVAIGLASEALEAVRAVADEKWQNIYNLTEKGSTHYKPVQGANSKWTLTAGDEAITLNTANFTRYVIVDNVSRDVATREIQPTYVSNDDDPSTQKVTVTVSWPNAAPVIVSEYFFRYRNRVCTQAGWVGNGLSGNNVQTCGTTTYDTIDTTVSTTTSPGNLQLI